MTQSTLPTLEDVARLADVSTATVSRCINAPERVAAATRARIESAIDALGYTPNFGARALVMRRTGIVGAVIPTLSSAIFSRAIQAFQHELDRAGWTLVLASSDSNRATEARQIRALIARGVDGLFLVGAERDQASYRLLQQRKTPFVIGWTTDVPASQTCVGFDNAGAMRALTERALALGHRRFGVISAPLDHNDRARARVSGVRDALTQFGLPASALMVAEVPYEIAAAGQAFDQLVADSEPPTIILCGNDVQAAGAIRRAQKLGFSVPDDMSITGFDNLEHAELVDPGVTTVAVPHDEMGKQAALALVAQVTGEPHPRTTCLATELVVRQSLGHAPSR
ncbi:MAG: LacI family DNA-binding transcriptional regulator [Pseudomonadota bacterium]